MKKIIAFLLCTVVFALLATSAFADSYSFISDKKVKLEYPDEKNYFAEPFEATAKASKKNGSIYIMPKAEAGNGHLGTVPNGETVLIMAEQSGYYFFMTEEGYCGWNGKVWFITDSHSEEKLSVSNKSTVSDKGVNLEYPEDKDYFSKPFVMLVKSSKSDGSGSIYLMPKPEAGNGNLGTVQDGKAVLILAERSGYYFFQTNDGHQGWNGKMWFE